MSGVVVFDFDNTIVHSKIDFRGIRTDLIALLRDQRATDESDETLRRLSIGQIIAIGDAHDGRKNTSLGPTAWQIVLDYERAGMREATVEDGAAEVFEALRSAGFRLAILTNNAREATVEAIERFELDGGFELVLTRDDVAMKPDPEGIAKAREALPTGTGRVVMVGDSWLDAAAAMRAGVPFVGFRARTDVLEERGVDCWSVIQRLDELPSLLQCGSWPLVGTR